MIKIAISLIHNKSNRNNELQITTLNTLITQIFEEINVEGIIKQAPTGIYKLNNLLIEHECKIYQIVPFGVRVSDNFNLLNSYNVYYGVGDENKIGEHPRFFNWILKRGTDHGANICLQLSDISNFTLSNLNTRLNTIDTEKFIETNYGKFGSLRLLREVGQLKEDRSIANAIIDLRSRING